MLGLPNEQLGTRLRAPLQRQASFTKSATPNAELDQRHAYVKQNLPKMLAFMAPALSIPLGDPLMTLVVSGSGGFG